MPLTPTFAISSASLIGHVGGKSTKVIDPFLLPSNVLSLIRTRSAGINFCKALFLPDGKLRSHCIRKLPVITPTSNPGHGRKASLYICGNFPIIFGVTAMLLSMALPAQNRPSFGGIASRHSLLIVTATVLTWTTNTSGCISNPSPPCPARKSSPLFLASKCKKSFHYILWSGSNLHLSPHTL